MRKIVIPSKMKTRPRNAQGIALPITVYVDNNTVREDVTDLGIAQECMENALCGMCGRILGQSSGMQKLEAWFLGLPISIQIKMFTNPPMHYKCAVYAAQAGLFAPVERIQGIARCRQYSIKFVDGYDQPFVAQTGVLDHVEYWQHAEKLSEAVLKQRFSVVDENPVIVTQPGTPVENNFRPRIVPKRSDEGSGESS